MACIEGEINHKHLTKEMIKSPEIEEYPCFVNLKKRTETNKIVVHCSATTNSAKIDRRAIDQIHRSQGWLTIGYHFLIKKDGTIQRGRPIDTVGSHVKGHNSDSIGICLVGGINSKGESCNNFTHEQFVALSSLIDYLLSVYRDCEVLGHRDFKGVSKDCPCFDVKSWYKYPKYIEYDGSEPKYSMSVADFTKINGQGPYEIGEVLRVG